MRNYLIDFQNIDWEVPAPGVRYKAYVKGNQRIRLVEFSEEFVEDNWCTKGHIGYILEGSISIDFSGKTTTFKAGDGFFIPEGEENRHKGKVAKGKKALIILFEET
jgi:quercetin dioxygenase-like cupin family protein